MNRYLKVYIERIENLEAISSDLRVGLEVGEHHSNSPIGTITRSGKYEFNHISIFDAKEGLQLTIYVLDAANSKLITSGIVDLSRLLGDNRMRKAEIRLRPIGTAVLRCQLFDFDDCGDFPDRLEVRVARANGLPPQITNPIVEVRVGENVMRTEKVGSPTGGRRVDWNQRFMTTYDGSQLCEIIVKDEMGDHELSGLFLLWEVLTHPQKILGGDIDMTDRNGAPSGTLRVALRMWHSRDMKLKAQAHRQQLGEFRRRKAADDALFESCSSVVISTEKRTVQDADDRLRAAASGLDTCDDIVDKMEIPASTKEQTQQQKRLLKNTVNQIERDLTTAEKYLQIMAHAASVEQWDLGRSEKAKIDAVQRDLQSAGDHSVTDEDQQKISGLRDQLDPISNNANIATNQLTDAVTGTKQTTDATQLSEYGQQAIRARKQLEILAKEAAKLGVAINQRLKENRRRLRQQDRSTLLVTTTPTNFSKPPVFPACCCCWI